MRYRLIALSFSVFLAGCGYNTIQTLEERTDQASGNIETQLQRRADLIPNLVATVKGYAAQEEAVFTQVAQARSGLVNAIRTGTPAQMEAANAQVTSALGRLFAVAEAYPQLKSDQLFLRLQDDLGGTENRIAVARTDYNQAAQEYNTYIRRFPQALTAKVTGAKAKTYFEAAEGSGTAPQVDFSRPPAKSP